MIHVRHAAAAIASWLCETVLITQVMAEFGSGAIGSNVRYRKRPPPYYNSIYDMTMNPLLDIVASAHLSAITDLVHRTANNSEGTANFLAVLPVTELAQVQDFRGKTRH
jgi:hypothetical protein